MKFLHKKLNERNENGTLRRLKPFSADAVDFYSNDYLGMTMHEGVRERAKQLLLENELYFRNGSAGSRLLSGHFAFYENVENELAHFYEADSALIYHSGYDAFLGTLSSLPSRTDTVIYDELIHASARDGIRLSTAKNYPFKHNDIADLETKIKKAEGNIFVVIETVYSMDGDISPLDEILRLQNKYGFILLIDEAHSGGIFGEKGRGISYPFSKNENIIRLVTFGKAYGVEGACVLGNKTLREYLINFSRPFIYTTAPSPGFFAKIKASVEIVSEADAQRDALNENIRSFQNLFSHYFPCNHSPIQIFKPGNISELKNITHQITEAGIAVRPIYSPTVKEGEERLRIVLHAFNNEFQLQNLFDCMGLK